MPWVVVRDTARTGRARNRARLTACYGWRLLPGPPAVTCRGAGAGWGMAGVLAGPVGAAWGLRGAPARFPDVAAFGAQVGVGHRGSLPVVGDVCLAVV